MLLAIWRDQRQAAIRPLSNAAVGKQIGRADWLEMHKKLETGTNVSGG